MKLNEFISKARVPSKVFIRYCSSQFQFNMTLNLLSKDKECNLDIFDENLEVERIDISTLNDESVYMIDIISKGR